MNTIRCMAVAGIAVGWLLTLPSPAHASDEMPASVRDTDSPENPRTKGMAMPIGQGQTSWLVMGTEFVGKTSAFVPSRNGNTAELACAIGSTEPNAIGRLALPDGVVLSAIDIWRYDVSTTQNLAVSIVQNCLPSANAGSGESFALTFNASPSTPGYSANSQTISIPTDSLQCSYFIKADFGEGCAAGQDLRLLGVRVHWGQP